MDEQAIGSKRRVRHAPEDEMRCMHGNTRAEDLMTLETKNADHHGLAESTWGLGLSVPRTSLNEGYACVEPSKKEGIEQRAERCHIGNTTACSPKPLHTSPTHQPGRINRAQSCNSAILPRGARPAVRFTQSHQPFSKQLPYHRPSGQMLCEESKEEILKAFIRRHSICGRVCAEKHCLHRKVMAACGTQSKSESELQGADTIGYACVERSKQSKMICKGNA
eukprot:352987-Chlamydomonas_euryale.AAC.10